MWKCVCKNYKRITAFILTLVIVLTNVGGSLSTVFAAEDVELALFLLDGSELQEAVREAKEQGEVFDFSSLELSSHSEDIEDKYQELLGAAEDRVYELSLFIDGMEVPEGAELRLFYREKTEDLVFLFLNGSDELYKFQVNIDGYETEPVKVKAHSANAEAGSKDPSAGTGSGSGNSTGNAGGPKETVETTEMTETSEATETTGIVEETESIETTETTEEETAETAETEEETETVETEGTAEADETSDVTETSEAEETREAEETTEGTVSEETAEEETDTEDTASEDDSETAEETEALEESEVNETEEETEAETEPEGEAEGSDQGAAEALGMSHHVVNRVAAPSEAADSESWEDDGTETEETEAEAQAPDHDEEDVQGLEDSSDTEEADTEAETQASEEDGTEAADTETEAQTEETSEETEGTDSETEIQVPESGTDTETEESKSEAQTPEDSTSPAAEETETEVRIPETQDTAEAAGTETETQVSEESTSSAAEETETEVHMSEADKNEMSENQSDRPETSVGSGKKEDSSKENPEEENLVLGKLKGKAYENVTIGEDFNARAYQVSMEEIRKALGTFSVEYTVNPEEAATVKGSDTVAEGDSLYFAVEPEEGYQIAFVSVNGQELAQLDGEVQTASSSDWKGYTCVYQVEAVEEDLLVEIELEEKKPVIPAAVYTAEAEDAIITVSVPENAFTEEVELKAEKVKNEQALTQAAQQAQEALKENQIITDMLAYDICFVTKEAGLEVEPAAEVEVSITLKNAMKETRDSEAEANEVSIVHLPEEKDAKVVATSENTDETEFAFQTDSFSTYLVAKVALANVTYQGSGYPTIQAALKAAETNKDLAPVIQLQEDIAESLTVTNTRQWDQINVTIDLNGKTWTGRGASAVTIKMGTSTKSLELNLISSAADRGTLKADNGYRVLTSSYTTTNKVSTNIAINIDGVNLEGNGSGIASEAKLKYDGTNSSALGGIIYFGGTGSLKIANSDVSHGVNVGTLAYGGAVYVAPVNTNSRMNLELDNCEFHDNESYSGDALAVTCQKNLAKTINLHVNECVFRDNLGSHVISVTNKFTGATSLTTEGSAITNSTFERNKTALQIGNMPGELSITGCKFSDNTDGAINFDCSMTRTGTRSLLVSDTEFVNNSSITRDRSGAIRTVSNMTATIERCTFTGNSAENNGGAVYSAGDLDIANCTFTDNQAAEDGVGGALYAQGQLTMADCTFTGNQAQYGGAVSIAAPSSSNSYAASKKTASLTNVQILNNTASKSGGGIYNNNQKLEVTGSTIKGNTCGAGYAGAGGGGIYAQAPEVILTDTIVTENTADAESGTVSGGGLYLCTGAKVKGQYTLAGNTHVYNNKAPSDAKPNGSNGGGASDEIFVRNTDVATNKAYEYRAILTGFDDPAIANTEDNGYKYTLTQSSAKYDTKSPGKFYTGYFSGVEEPTRVYLGKEHTGGKDQDYTSLKEAYEAAVTAGVDTIYVCSTVPVSEADNAYLKNSAITFMWCTEHHSGPIMTIEGEVTFDGTQINGLGIPTGSSLVEVKSGAVLNIKEGTLIEKGNSANGGAVHVSNGAVVNMSGGAVKASQASHDGGGVYVSSSGEFNMTGGAIDGNTAGHNGGGLYVNGTAWFDGGSVTNNTSGNYGGGIDVWFGKAYLGVNGGRPEISNNTSTSEGGGICFEIESSGKIYRGDFVGNKTTLYSHYVAGGGISVQRSAFLEMQNVYVSANQSLKYENYGSFYTCPTGETALLEVNGALMVDNYGTAGRKIPDIYHYHLDQYPDNKVFVSDEALGGGDIEFYAGTYKLDRSDYQWTTRSFAMRSRVSDETKRWAKEKAFSEGVVVTGNQGSGPGSAIANNGTLIIGTETNSLQIKKVWDDGDNPNRPEQVLVYLTRDGKIVDTDTRKDAVVILSEANDWSYVWGNLDPAHTWSVIEAEITGYTWTLGEPEEVSPLANGTPIKGFNQRILTNKKEDTRTTTLKITKSVKAETENAQSFDFTLSLGNLEEGHVYAYKLSSDNVLRPIYDPQNITFSLKSGESFQIEGLPEGVTYTVTEVSGADYRTYINGVLTEDAKADGTVGAGEDTDSLLALDFVNVEKTRVEIAKKWDDAEDQDGIRPDEIQVELIGTDSSNNTVTLPEELNPVTLKKAEGWSYTVENLPKYDAAGGEITWTIKEKPVAGYESGEPIHSESASPGIHFEITNTHIPETVSIRGVKIWNDQNNQDGKRPAEITVNLYADTSQDSSPVASQVVRPDQDGNWKWEFTGYPKYHSHGLLVTYTVTETSLDDQGYWLESFVNPDSSNDYSGQLVNKYDPETTSFVVIKVWDDHDNQDGLRPASIRVQLKNGDKNVGDPVELNEANGWRHLFTGLPKYENQGTAIEYHVEEIQTDELRKDYTSEVQFSEEDNTFTVTNHHTSQTVSRTVRKVWDDKDNKDNIRPDSISVQLLADGTVYESVILNEANNWTWTWQNLDKMNQGKEIVYTVRETLVEGYTAAYTTEGDVLVITNSHTPTPDPDPKPDPKPTPDPDPKPTPDPDSDEPDSPDSSTDRPERPIIIENPEVPLANLPEDPMSQLIEDLEVPLLGLPKTGDKRHGGLLCMLMGLSGMGAMFAGGFKKRKEDSDK